MKPTMMALAGISFLGGCASPQSTAPRSPQVNAIVDTKAKAIVDQMLTTYSNCQSYLDSGTCVGRSGNVTFSTRLRRPDRIYFEYSEAGNPSGSKNVYWTEGVRKKFHEIFPDHWEDSVETTMWWGDDKTYERNQSLGNSVASFTGVSSGTGFTVPSMLFPKEVGMLSFLDMTDLTFEKEEEDRGSMCDVLYSRHYLERIWIDETTHLLKRIVERTDEQSPERTTEYQPQINVPITDDQLVFKP